MPARKNNKGKFFSWPTPEADDATELVGESGMNVPRAENREVEDLRSALLEERAQRARVEQERDEALRRIDAAEYEAEKLLNRLFAATMREAGSDAVATKLRTKLTSVEQAYTALREQVLALPRYQEHDVVRRPSTVEYFDAEQVEGVLSQGSDQATKR